MLIRRRETPRPTLERADIRYARAIKPNVQYSHELYNARRCVYPATCGMPPRMVHLFYIIDTVLRACECVLNFAAPAHALAQKHAAHLYQFIVRAGDDGDDDDDSQSDDVCINWVYFAINRERTHAGRGNCGGGDGARYGSITVR